MRLRRFTTPTLIRRWLGIGYSEEEIHKRAGSFFERLWQYDLVVFDASKTITMEM
jgi:hypothetical protein